MENNFMNYNEIFPILDIINRRVKQMQNKGTTHVLESPFFSGGDNSNLNSTDWEVQSFQVIRDTSNPIDPNVIQQLIIMYRNGAIDRITLTRGLVPQVDSSVTDYEYINNLMLTELKIATELLGDSQEVIAKIIRENGYGAFQRVEMEFVEHDHEMEEEEFYPYDEIGGDITEYENPNDFYNNVPSYEDDDEDEGEDFVDYPYTDEDAPEMSEDGWADGSIPSDPMDITIGTVIEMGEDFSGTVYDEDTVPEIEETDNEIEE